MNRKPEAGNPLLIEKIIREMKQCPGGVIPFNHFMDMCLYDDEYGYYTSKSVKIGKQGDFYTSASVGGIIGQVLAMHAVRTIPPDQPVRLIEWGAGTGMIAGQILDTLRIRYPNRYEAAKYTIIDVSPDHLEQAEAALAAHRHQVQFFTPAEWEKGKKLNGFIYMLSNELLDSFPVHRVRMRKGILHELYVRWDGAAGRIIEAELPCTNPDVLLYMEKGNIQLRNGQTAEINLLAKRWIADRLNELREGVLVTIDYGDQAKELFAGHRMNGTLVCYKRHAAHDDPFIHIGEQDMTAHVDFTACMEAGEGAGAAGRLMTQRQFLVEADIFSLLQEHTNPDPFSPEARRNRAIRQLLLSDQMSELFKVLIQYKRL